MTDDTLELRALKPFAIGGTRRCYIHPKDQNLCVKVLREDRTPEVRKSKTQGFKQHLPLRNFDDQWKEQCAYEALMPKASQDTWKHVPEYFGTVNTDMGLGIVTRVFRNHDDTFPLTLEHLVPKGITDSLERALQEFKAWLRQELFLSRHLLPHNIIVVETEPSTYTLVIVDGIGNSEMIPISSWFDFFAKRKIERKIVYLDYRLRELDQESVI